MADSHEYPTFDEQDRSIFAIKENRERADKMRDVLVPRLREIAKVAFARIKNVYGIDPLALSTESLSPEHRPDAVKTKEFNYAAAGLVMRQLEGKYHYLNFRFELSKKGLLIFITASRPLESAALLGVLRDYKENVLRIFDEFGVYIRGEKIEPNTSNEQVIETTRVDHGQQWWVTYLIGRGVKYPIHSDDDVHDLVNRFVAMFPVYQATCERLAGREDHFADYFASLQSGFASDDGDEVEETEIVTGDADEGDDVAIDTLNPERSATEGEVDYALRRHLRHKKWLRARKIQEVQDATGRLRCEVPGCGFDFFEVYGERGLGFAHVHHNLPLGDRSESSETKLSDLSIVCPNCHAMIHQGKEIPALSDLIRKR